MKIKKENWKIMNKILERAYLRVDDYNIDHKLVDYLYDYIKSNNLPLFKLDEYINELIKGRPVQYIVGDVDFCGNIIQVNENVLIPRFETELLVDKTIKYIRKLFRKQISILDVGTGSGCIAITLAKETNSIVSACDISLEALLVAKKNAKLNKVDINFIYSDLFSNVKGKFDVIISNPPYIAYDEEVMDVVFNNEPKIALYASDNGLFCYEEMFKVISNYLEDNFLIALEIGWKQGKDVIKLIRKYLGLEVNVALERDYNDRDRFVFVWKID